MNHLKKLKQRVLDAKKQFSEGGISPDEQSYLVGLAQDKYFLASIGDEFIDKCVEKYRDRILEGK